MNKQNIISLILQMECEENNFQTAACAVTESVNVLTNIIQTTKDCPTRTKEFYEKVIPAFSLDEFATYFRLNRSQFEKLLQDIGGLIENTCKIPLEKQLLFTIWCLAHSSSFSVNSEKFNMSKGTAHFVFCRQITNINKLIKKYIKWPNNEEKGIVEREFQKKCGFRGVVGCIDGCHIPIKQPPGNSNDYYNRKGFQSIVLQAICDHKCVFRDIFVGSPGRSHDSRIFSNSPIYAAINNTQNPLLNHDEHILGDCGYPLLINLLTPYKDNGHLQEYQRNYNIKLSSARVYIERSFGILKSKFRKLKYLEIANLEHSNEVITACCILHNIIREENAENDEITFHFDGTNIPTIPRFSGIQAAKNKRNFIALTF